MAKFTFVCECCLRAAAFDGPTVQDARGDAQRARWIVKILYSPTCNSDPVVRALCDNKACDFPK